MSSTIANLDIEELVYAFAGYVGHKVIAATEPLKGQKDNFYDINLNKLKFDGN